MEFISGEARHQTIMLPDTVDDYVDWNSAVRVIDAYVSNLNLGELGFAKADPNGTGRPMYDPKDILKLYVYGYMNRIRSSRRLEAESKRNLEVIWLTGKLSPDHKTIARFRHDNGKALKNVFRDFVALCVRMGLYGRELIAVDGSKFKAVNSRKRNFTEKQIRDKIISIAAKIDEYLKELESNDAAEDAAGGEKTKEEIAQIISGLKERKERYQGYADELEKTGEKQKSLTDADSRLMTTNSQKMDVCYNVQTAVDAKNKLIVEFEASNQGNDKNFITPMANASQKLLGTRAITVVADAGYESIADIMSARNQGVDAHVAGTDFDVCVPAKEGEASDISSHHKGRCVYIAERNIALCPMGNVLYPAYQTTHKQKGPIGVFYNYRACARCACKCTTDPRGRFQYKIPMDKEDFSKDYNDRDLSVKQIRIKPDKEIIRQRKSIVEHPFGTIKRSMDSGYCLTKGFRNVLGEFSLAFLAYNLKRVINILGCGKLIENMA
ncbi:IS1182 family transposase [Treponema sp. R80B11-R83G3]